MGMIRYLSTVCRRGLGLGQVHAISALYDFGLVTKCAATRVYFLAVDGDVRRSIDAYAHALAFDGDYRDPNVAVDDDFFVDATCKD